MVGCACIPEKRIRWTKTSFDACITIISCNAICERYVTVSCFFARCCCGDVDVVHARAATLVFSVPPSVRFHLDFCTLVVLLYFRWIRSPRKTFRAVQNQFPSSKIDFKQNKENFWFCNFSCKVPLKKKESAGKWGITTTAGFLKYEIYGPLGQSRCLFSSGINSCKIGAFDRTIENILERLITQIGLW